jgi:hypothetical protein
MDGFIWFTDNVVDRFGIWVGIFLAIPVFWTWYVVSFGRRAQHRRWFRSVKTVGGTRPAILIVDLFEKGDASVTVERFRRNEPALSEIPDDNVFTVRRKKHLKADDMPDVVQELHKVAEEIFKNGTDVLHYFHAGPVITAALVGAEFGNTCRVILYHHNQGTYENWGPLRHTH